MSWLLRDRDATFKSKHDLVQVGLLDGSSSLSIQPIDPHDEGGALYAQISPYDGSLSVNTLASLGKMKFGEAYVRQNDLTVSYPERSPWQFGFQLDMRLIPLENNQLLCIELWFSVQTSLLDSHPQLDFRLQGEAFESVSPELWLSQTKRFCLSVHPLDRPDCTLDSTSQSLHFKLFGRFMEKGVIRRMRFRLTAASRAQATSFWKDQLEEFSVSPLPLNT